MIYAGSLVNPQLLEYKKEGCLGVQQCQNDIWKKYFLSCDKAEAQGKRLDHCAASYRRSRASTAPSVSRWMCWMKRESPYDYCPGVSAFCGAASALNLEYTLPDVSQSVVITRMEGRTPVPPKRRALPVLCCPSRQRWLFSFSTGLLGQLSSRAT